MPSITTHNNLLGSYLTNLRSVWINDVREDYKVQLLEYATLYKDLPVYGHDDRVRTRSRFAIWYKILSFWQASDPSHVDLSSVNAEDIAALGEHIYSIADAVEFGAIPVVEGYLDFTELMVELT